jgi:hypothetical protein
VRHGPPAVDPKPRGEDLRQVRTLRVERSGGTLDVRESRPVLEVEQRGLLEVPRHHVRASRELIVLVGLVQADDAAVRAEPARLPLAQRGVDGIHTTRRSRSSLVVDARRELESERRRETNVRLHRSDPAGLHAVHEPDRDACPTRDLADRQPAPDPLVVERLTEQDGEAGDGERRRPRRVLAVLGRRHSAMSEHVRAHRGLTAYLR